MRDIAVTLAFFLALPIAVVRPWVGVLIWAWIGYMNPHQLCFGFATVFPFAMVVFLVTLFALFFSGDRKLPKPSRELIVLLLLLLWFTFTTAQAYDSDRAWNQWNKVIRIQAGIILTMILIYNRERINALIWTIALSLGYYGFNGLVYVITTGGGSNMRGPDGTFIAGNTDLALALVMTLPLLRYLQIHAPQRWMRLGMLALMGMTALSVVATYSRGGLLAMVGMAGLLWLKSRNKLPVLLVVLVILPVVFTFMPDKWHERMSTIDEYEEDASAMGRINAWRFATNVVKDHPVGGLGFGTFNPQLFLRYAPNPYDYHDAHSIYFKILAEHGIVGMALFLLFFLLGWRTSTQVIKATRGKPEHLWASDLSAMLQTSMFGYALGGAFLGMCYFDLPYHLVAIAVLIKQSLQDEGAMAPSVYMSPVSVPVRTPSAARIGTA